MYLYFCIIVLRIYIKNKQTQSVDLNVAPAVFERSVNREYLPY